MKRIIRVLWWCGIGAGLALQTGCAGPGRTTARVGAYTISGPHVFRNLAVFLIRGKDTVAGKKFLTLDEALEQKKAVVHETGNVGQLTIENTSQEFHVYVQSGVIVKGGKQDRTLQYDMVLPPRSGKVALKSFCVEQGRWSRRGGESAAQFSSAKSNLATKELKLAAKLKNSQAEVWKSVAKSQSDLGANLGQSVQSGQSASSLQLTLENKKLRATAQEYARALRSLPEGNENVIGYAFAINGEINSADVYGSRELFCKLWPKLLEATAVEAIAKLQKDTPFPDARIAAVEQLFLDAAKGKKSEKDLTHGAKMTIKESDQSVSFSVHDKKEASAVYRFELLKK